MTFITIARFPVASYAAVPNVRRAQNKTNDLGRPALLRASLPASPFLDNFRLADQEDRPLMSQGGDLPPAPARGIAKEAERLVLALLGTNDWYLYPLLFRAEECATILDSAQFKQAGPWKSLV